MRRLSYYLLTMIVLASCSHLGSSTPSVVPLLEPGKTPDEATLKECEQHCVPTDAAVASALDQMSQLRKLDKAGGSMKTTQKDAHDAQKNLFMAMSNWFEANKDSTDPKRALTAYRYGRTFVMLGKMMDPALAEKWNGELQAGTGNLPARFPNEADAYLLRAQNLGSNESELELVIGDFRKCLELNPQEKMCARGYKSATVDFLSPSCAGENISPELKFFLSGKKRDKDHSHLLHIGKEKVYLAKEPSMDATAVAFARSARVRAGARVSEEKGAHEEVMLELTPEGKKKFADLTGANVGTPLAVTLGNEVLLNAVIRSRIDGGRVLVTMGSDAEPSGKVTHLIERMCTKVIERELPDALKLPAGVVLPPDAPPPHPGMPMLKPNLHLPTSSNSASPAAPQP